MARYTRKRGVFRRLYSPISHAIMASKESIGAITNTARDVACDGLTGLDKIGKSVTTHANMAVEDILGKRKRRSTRKSKKPKMAKRKN